MASEMSKEEIEKAEAEISAETDEFKDAIDGEDEHDGSFNVTIEEMSILRAELASEFPEDYNYLSDSYIRSVASKPYSKDPSIRRPLEYSQKKLNDVMRWREEGGATELEELVKIANGRWDAPEATSDPERYTKAKALVTSLNYGSTYWHGFTKDGHPVLWLRTSRKAWYPDSDAEVNALILLSDAGIRCMPDGITDFVVIADSTSPPPPNPTFMVKLLKALVKGYPDRLHQLISAPISSIVQFVMNLLLPLMPGRLAAKVLLKGAEEGKTILKEILLNGEDDVPTFMGGTANHDEFYPDEGYCPNRGEGTLKFDYFGMVERLEKVKAEWEALQK
mmetsp:Transcript_34455/g.38080  ORF Transcript_34455/g.38080 Transcript_34455/m.38080 type:complete len:335 (-) Transcript_34455:53-1057(-)|eukprot:CAMPEP_0194145292 /NCGR_PEP_ID=MMETSP0152-20130528/16345_1 /TAXON_ID=1049557 /ORGANISM="Thalassiothrix antarctica, Strain L6-D1" /LENGTH=334 /DNA_ID=CAMNT_0038845441 /DNA_START=85 /DNA_END=1089 /DNA_ORIENTATION=+